MEEVRIDKYLWAIRVYKTRTDATDACKGGKVRLNGADVKPSKTVKVGDTLVARKGAVVYTYKVLALVDKRQGAKLVPTYAENLTPAEELAKLRAPVETFFLKFRSSGVQGFRSLGVQGFRGLGVQGFRSLGYEEDTIDIKCGFVVRYGFCSYLGRCVG